MRTTLREVTSGLGNLADNGTTSTLPREYQRSLQALERQQGKVTTVGNTRATEVQSLRQGAQTNGLGDLVLVVQ